MRPPRRDRPPAPSGWRAPPSGRAGGDDLAVDQHRDLVAEREHHAHVVLDDQQRAALGDRADQLHDVGRLLARHAGRRLVQQQDLRIGGERHADLERALLGVGEVAGEVVAPPGQAQLLEVLVDLGVDRREPAAPGRNSVKRWPMPPHHRDAQVLRHAHAREDVGDLERARQPAPVDDVRRQARDRLAVEQDLARVGT